MSRFVILYQGATDPTAGEEHTLVSSLKSATVIDRMPGSLLVDGPEAEVASVVKNLKHWTFSPAGSVSIEPPRRVRRQPALPSSRNK